MLEQFSVRRFTPAALVSAICSGCTCEHWSYTVTAVLPTTETWQCKKKKFKNTSSAQKVTLQWGCLKSLLKLGPVPQRLVKQQIISLTRTVPKLAKHFQEHSIDKCSTNSVWLYFLNELHSLFAKLFYIFLK